MVLPKKRIPRPKKAKIHPERKKAGITALNVIDVEIMQKRAMVNVFRKESLTASAKTELKKEGWVEGKKLIWKPEKKVRKPGKPLTKMTSEYRATLKKRRADHEKLLNSVRDARLAAALEMKIERIITPELVEEHAKRLVRTTLREIGLNPNIKVFPLEGKGKITPFQEEVLRLIGFAERGGGETYTKRVLKNLLY